jgi:hypothetical protein
MKVIWKGGTSRGGMGQWVFFCLIAALIGFAALVVVALGLVVGAVLVGIISIAAALASRRRAGGASVYAEEKCVELDKDSYTVRVVDEKSPPAA